MQGYLFSWVTKYSHKFFFSWTPWHLWAPGRRGWGMHLMGPGWGMHPLHPYLIRPCY